MVECGRGCQHSTVGRMHGEPCDTECNACKPMSHDQRGGRWGQRVGGQVGGQGGGDRGNKGDMRGTGVGSGPNRLFSCNYKTELAKEIWVCNDLQSEQL